MSIYNSKKISELRARNVITKHQENSWLPVAQYNERTDSYTNITLPIKAITDYSYSYASAYTTNVINQTLEDYFAEDWVKLHDIGDTTYTIHEMTKPISYSGIATNLVAYSFTYTLDHFEWQKFI